MAKPEQLPLFDNLFTDPGDNPNYRELFLDEEGSVKQVETVDDWLDNYYLEYIASRYRDRWGNA